METPRSTVLIVEDNATQSDLYAMVLEDTFDVLQAGRAESGYELACRHRPDVILLDVLLPDVDGLALAERLRANADTASIPIVVLTADDTAYARAQRVRSDLTGVFMKPHPADRLLSVLKDAVQRVG